MKSKNPSMLLLVLVVLMATSCKSNLKVISDQGDKNHDDYKAYIITPEALRDTIKLNTNSIVVFWTDWCGASKQNLKNTYLPLFDSIQSNNLDFKLILIAGDNNIPFSEIKAYKEKGISAFYIPKSGGHPIGTRLALRKYINKAFPDNEISQIKFDSFIIPIILLVDKDLNVINDLNRNIVYEFIYKQLN